MLEEGKKGNLERECIEELCSKEEAREIFENNPETEYFYPRYIVCLGSHRVGILNSNSDITQDLRTCIKEISNQCKPLPCHSEGSVHCVDGYGTYTCQCKPGWKGVNCEEDINECEDPDHPSNCKQECFNLPGSFHCLCQSGYYLQNTIDCIDVNECRLYPSMCEEPARCINTPGSFKCQCSPGFKYNFTSHECQDIDECKQNLCKHECVNSMGSYTCHCDGRVGQMLAADGHTCEEIPECLPLHEIKHEELLYLGEQVAGLPMIFLRYRFKENKKFAAEFDFRTFDPEGIVLYAESFQDSWFMLGLRNGHIEVQFKNPHSSKVTSGGKAINDGQWHVISVEELESSISVKISKEAVMSISSPGNLFAAVDGKLETTVYISGLPNRTNSVIKPINPRLDGCIRGWDLMNQGASGLTDAIHGRESMHCFVSVERGSYFSGAGLAYFNIDYGLNDQWKVNISMSIRPSSSTGVLLGLISNNTVPLSVAVKTQGPNDADLQVFLDGISVAKLESLRLCYPDPLLVEMHVSADGLQISANSSTVSYAEADILSQALAKLKATMQHPVLTYIGGLPAHLPLSSTPVSAHYHGCMEIRVNGQLLDFDEAISKHNSIKSHSCPPVSQSHP